jgi:hypothetical protein
VTINILSRRGPHEYLLQAFFVKELREETCLASAVGTKNAAAITYVSGARVRLYTSKPPFKVATDNVMCLGKCSKSPNFMAMRSIQALQRRISDGVVQQLEADFKEGDVQRNGAKKNMLNKMVARGIMRALSYQKLQRENAPVQTTKPTPRGRSENTACE